MRALDTVGVMCMSTHSKSSSVGRAGDSNGPSLSLPPPPAVKSGGNEATSGVHRPTRRRSYTGVQSVVPPLPIVQTRDRVTWKGKRDTMCMRYGMVSDSWWTGRKEEKGKERVGTTQSSTQHPIPPNHHGLA